MHSMAEALKALQLVMFNQGKTNAKLPLTLEEAKKNKGANPNREATKAMKIYTQILHEKRR
jgi:hypothetical protein